MSGAPAEPARQPARRPARRALHAYVRRTEWLTASMVRLVLGGGGLASFPGPSFADAYVKLVFLDPGVAEGIPDGPLDLDGLPSPAGAAGRPRLRTYTVRRWDPVRHELTLDVVVHGAEGLAGPWAAQALPGDRAFLLGPGGGYRPDAAVPFHLLVGDPSALPAIAVALESLPGHARGRAFIEVGDASDEQPLVRPPGVELRWLRLNGRAPGSALVPAVLAEPVPAEPVQAFVHGEAGFVREVRRHVRAVWGVPPERLSASGYWRRGVDDEGWRATKRDWVRATEEDDAQHPEPDEAR